MTVPDRMKFGIFLGPFHRVGENPTLAIDRDLELIQWLDYLGYDEAWIGEHHSAGWETISSPEIFIAVAADRIGSLVRAYAGAVVCAPLWLVPGSRLVERKTDPLPQGGLP